ncbi:hypothetical protein [Rhodopseudomonas pseudopalustris]|uniref:hypothetical protein n=1 Tax=Rhodopseudomonas pseudopalustris TaxID=1513892 RepID=UPI00111407F7|nr:hypothetical protein [Rhodopseudomonas pseudopalustris]MBB1091467.1 hypothetical protein [Rhodopseudomonas palustris]
MYDIENAGIRTRGSRRPDDSQGLETYMEHQSGAFKDEVHRRIDAYAGQFLVSRDFAAYDVGCVSNVDAIPAHIF